MSLTTTTFLSIGSYDLDQHKKTKKHRNNIREASTTRSLTNFVVQRFSPEDLKICAAEGALAYHVIVHHLSFRSQDCNASLLREIFGDSAVAKKLSCARTKTEAIINNVLMLHVMTIMDEELEKTPFVSLSTDASNHGHIKLFPIVVQFFDPEKGGIQVRILDLCELPDEKAETIATMLLNVMEEHHLKKKTIVFSADNTNSNFGGLNRKGNQNVHKLLEQKIDRKLLGIGCLAHILHNSGQHGLDRFGLFDIDSLVFKIYQYFSNSTTRTTTLKEFCNFVEIACRDILYHTKTRWLSLMPVIHRILQLFPALKSYFNSADKPPALLDSFFTHDFSECFLLFSHSFMAVFHDNVLKLEKEKNSVIEIINIIDNVAAALRDRIENEFLPFAVKTILSRLRADGKDKECSNFVQRAIEVYKEAEEYLIKWTASLSDFRVNIFTSFNARPSSLGQNVLIYYCSRFSSGLISSKMFNLHTLVLKIP